MPPSGLAPLRGNGPMTAGRLTSPLPFVDEPEPPFEDDGIPNDDEAEPVEFAPEIEAGVVDGVVGMDTTLEPPASVEAADGAEIDERPEAPSDPVIVDDGSGAGRSLLAVIPGWNGVGPSTASDAPELDGEVSAAGLAPAPTCGVIVVEGVVVVEDD